MFLFGVFLLSFASAQVCDVSENNSTTNLNYGCNNAGYCVLYFGISVCACCEPGKAECGKNWVCDPNDPQAACYYWKGTKCEEVEEAVYANFGFRVENLDTNQPGDITCSTIPAERERDPPVWGTQDVDFTAQVQQVLGDLNYASDVVPALYCDTCSGQYPCTLNVNVGINATEGTTHAFQVQFNAFYDEACAVNKFYIELENAQDAECEANYDFGGKAKRAFDEALSDEVDFVARLNSLLSAQSDSSNNYLGLGWSNSIIMGFRKTVKQETRTILNTRSPTQFPTEDPTPNPTPMPTLVPTETPTTSGCRPYLNDVADLSFLGVGSNCRGGLEGSYPGGLTCNSPYIICLPQENTPASFDDKDYKSPTHRYSVDECLQECANDQRCSGIEFEADSNSALGTCTLIDDIPVVITSTVNSDFNYDSSTVYPNLDSSVTGGAALCFQKQNYCNPYFEADDLNDTMLDCYCPNNRKGFYTKKVKRTEVLTRFCGDDTEVDTRVKKAQANRMFHLCENWCLFDTEDPMAEAWYWDPWNACFREQNMDTGVHMSYCNRVIRSPDTIEMKFINRRVDLQCNSTSE